MNRLTRKEGAIYYIADSAFPYAKIFDINQKLGKLEDLEEELGCPFDVVFKALTEGVHIQAEFLDLTIKDFILRPRLYFSNDFKCYCLETGYGANMIKLKDYQKTWRLKGDK